jgi:NAD(P)H dehydrogenase (quinone)
MNILVLLAHPDPASFNHAIARASVGVLERNGHRVRFHDLCAERFESSLPAEEIPSDARIPESIEPHCRELADADGIVIVHPNWWGQPPAVLKGWIDRVVRPGVAYRFIEGDGGDGIPLGLLKAGAAIVFNTSNTAAAREAAEFGDPLETLWRNCVFGLCGVRNVSRRTFGIVVTSSEAQRRAWLADAEALVDLHFPAVRSRREPGSFSNTP